MVKLGEEVASGWKLAVFVHLCLETQAYAAIWTVSVDDGYRSEDL